MLLLIPKFRSNILNFCVVCLRELSPQNIFSLHTLLEYYQFEEKKRSLEKLGVVLLRVPSEKGEINLQLLMRKLGELGIDSVLIEGGGTLNEDALQSGIVNEVKAFIAPKIFGGRGGKTPVEGFGVEKVDDAIKLQLMRISQVGEDILAEYKVLEEM